MAYPGVGQEPSYGFYTGKLVLSMDNPTIVVITDRNDLDDQLLPPLQSPNRFCGKPRQAESRSHLKGTTHKEAGV